MNGHRPSVRRPLPQRGAGIWPAGHGCLDDGHGGRWSNRAGRDPRCGWIYSGSEPGDLRSFWHAEGGHRTRICDADVSTCRILPHILQAHCAPETIEARTGSQASDSSGSN